MVETIQKVNKKDMIVSLNQGKGDMENVDKSQPEYIFHYTKQAGPYTGPPKPTADSMTPTKEMKEMDVSKEAAKVASIAPVERSQEPLYTPYRPGPISDIPKDWNAMPAPGDAKPEAKADAKPAAAGDGVPPELIGAKTKIDAKKTEKKAAAKKAAPKKW